MGGGGIFLGSVYATMRFDTGAFSRDVAKVNNELSGLDNQTQKATSSNKGLASAVFLGTVAARGFSAAIGQIRSSLGGAIKRVDTLNNSTRTFENMGFATEDTAAAMKELERSITGLPTPLDAGVRGMTSLAATYGDVKKGQAVFSSLNNAILGFGGTTEMVNNAILQLSQLPMDGPLDAQTWNSLRNSGLTPVLVAMSKDMGISVNEMKKKFGEGELSVQDFTDRLIKMNKDGGGGLKSLEQIARDSTKGIGTGFANMQTAIVRGTGSILTAIGPARISGAISAFGKAFEGALKGVAGGVAGAVDSIVDIGTRIATYLTPAVRYLSDSISGPLMTSIHSLISSPFAQLMGTTFVVAINLAIYALGGLVNIFAGLIQSFSNASFLLTGLVTAYVAWRLAVVASNAILAIQNGLMAAQATQVFLLNGALVTVRGTTILATVAQTALNTAMRLNPIALVIGAVAGIIGAYAHLVTSSDSAKDATNRLKDAKDRLKASTDALKEAENQVADARLARSGADIAVERATERLTQVRNDTSASALDLKEAEYNLEVAQHHAKEAAQRETEALDTLGKKQGEVASDTRLVASEDAKKRAIENVTTQIGTQRTQLGNLGLELGQLNGKHFQYSVTGNYSTAGDAKEAATGTRVPFKFFGGEVRRGQPYFVGENRDGSLNKTSELFVPSQSGHIYSSAELRRLMSGAGAPSSSSQHIPAMSGGANVENNYYIELPNVQNADDFTREFKLATMGRGD